MTTNRQHAGLPLFVDVIFSPDDDGYYAEVWDNHTGKCLHTTEVFAYRIDAHSAAMLWIKESTK